MKKRFAILLTLLAALLLCGCGEKADEQRWLEVAVVIGGDHPAVGLWLCAGRGRYGG